MGIEPTGDGMRPPPVLKTGSVTRLLLTPPYFPADCAATGCEWEMKNFPEHYHACLWVVQGLEAPRGEKNYREKWRFAAKKVAMVTLSGPI